MMKNFTELTKKEAKKIKGVLTDIDGTLTQDGKLCENGFKALWKAKNHGLFVLPVTGRSAGWCDMIARFWPVTGVIGENGALYFYMQDKKLKRYFVKNKSERAKDKKKLLEIKDTVLKKYKTINEASDQPYRETDLAIDFCEDVPDHGLELATTIKQIFEDFNATAKISSIHVNGWFGKHDKLKTTKLFLKEILKIDSERAKESFIYFGDSPNDQEMFGFFPMSFGIGNIEKYGDLISQKPSFKSSQDGGNGVLEVIEHILKLQTKERT